MKIVKILTAGEAAELVSDSNVLAIGGCENVLAPEALLSALGQRFVDTGSPRNLTELHPVVVGMGEGRGLESLAHRGLVARAIGSSFSFLKTSKYTALLKEDAFEAHILPMGTIFQMLRDRAAGRSRTITSVGLGTFVDPEIEGGRVNGAAKTSLARRIEIEGETHLAYEALPIDVAFIRGTCADENGNISFEDEPVSLGARAIAQATKASGGRVIVQVRRVTRAGTIHPRMVEIPGIFVDAIVVVPDQAISGGAMNPFLTGQYRLPLNSMRLVGKGVARIIASRATEEISDGETVNLGVGMPIEIPAILHEYATCPHTTFFPEHGSIGGVPGERAIFGTNINPDAIIDSTSVFDSFQGGALDATFLGCGQIDAYGNVNVSKFNGIIPGCGGFIDIVSRTPRVTFCGSFNAGGLDISTESGRLNIHSEGRFSKFVPDVEQITFNAQVATGKGQTVKYITERAVFRLIGGGLELFEVAPGIDVRRDVLEQIPFEVTVSDQLAEMARRHFQ
ncbi:CoA-transferase [Phyllobacterium chamaecytisi]|uniref:CoA-transferase n=1 Tax=Phyllobacterium chamaecytisi TaxID=2876082 RepID=UPI001CCD6574|nr:CoA-transferase [Phyllobacterium sp. KW56]MBZ9603284.1 acyl CoA:acetate/3-ketoacid CoA transferase [Phyllobacterium sp. KW56]